MPMFNLFLKLEFVQNSNKTPYPFMNYTEVNVNRFWLNCITWHPARSLHFFTAVQSLIPVNNPH